MADIASLSAILLAHRSSRGRFCQCGENFLVDEKRLVPPQWAEHVARLIIADLGGLVSTPSQEPTDPGGGT